MVHVDKATNALRGNLTDPTTVDDGDLFVAFLLALWYLDSPIDTIRESAETHVEGTVALMKHLSEKDAHSKSPLRLLWLLIRDEIVRQISYGNHCLSELVLHKILECRLSGSRQSYINLLRSKNSPDIFYEYEYFHSAGTPPNMNDFLRDHANLDSEILDHYTSHLSTLAREPTTLPLVSLSCVVTEAAKSYSSIHTVRRQWQGYWDGGGIFDEGKISYFSLCSSWQLRNSSFGFHLVCRVKR
jgi:hypothetical protein